MLRRLATASFRLAASREASAARAAEGTTDVRNDRASSVAASIFRRPPSTSTPSLFRSRPFSTSDGRPLDARLEEINRMFATAREDLEDAKEDAETTYFAESYNAAHSSVNETLETFEALLSELGEGEAGSVRRSMGLKMLQLKAELDELEPH